MPPSLRPHLLLRHEGGSHDAEPCWPPWGLHDPRSNPRGVQPLRRRRAPRAVPSAALRRHRSPRGALHKRAILCVKFSGPHSDGGFPGTAAENEQMLVSRTEDGTQGFASPDLRG